MAYKNAFQRELNSHRNRGFVMTNFESFLYKDIFLQYINCFFYLNVYFKRERCLVVSSFFKLLLCLEVFFLLGLRILSEFQEHRQFTKT